jgi:hypothetical protein
MAGGGEDGVGDVGDGGRGGWRRRQGRLAGWPEQGTPTTGRPELATPAVGRQSWGRRWWDGGAAQAAVLWEDGGVAGAGDADDGAAGAGDTGGRTTELGTPTAGRQGGPSGCALGESVFGRKKGKQIN